MEQARKQLPGSRIRGEGENPHKRVFCSRSGTSSGKMVLPLLSCKSYFYIRSICFLCLVSRTLVHLHFNHVESSHTQTLASMGHRRGGAVILVESGLDTIFLSLCLI